MKNKTLMYVLILSVIGVLVYYYMQNKKKNPSGFGNSTFTDYLRKLAGVSLPTDTTATPGILAGMGGPNTQAPGKNNVVPHSGVVPANSKDDKDFFRAQGFSDLYLSRLSKKDATIARRYIEDYRRKGRTILPTDKLWNDVVRISKYINLFPTPTFNPILPNSF